MVGVALSAKLVGIDFPGWDPTTSHLIAEVEIARRPPKSRSGASADDARGANAIPKAGRRQARPRCLGDKRSEKNIGPRDEPPREPTLRDVHEALIAVYATDYGLRSAENISRFSDITRQAASYRDRRVLAGRRRSARALPRRRTRAQSERSGFGESGMEAGPGGSWNLARTPAGYLSHGAAPGWCPRVAQYHGAHRDRRPEDRVNALREMIV